MPVSQWQTYRQRDFTGGENLSLLPEQVGRNQLIRMENAIISPQGEITDCWQMDTPLFINVPDGMVLVPVPGSRLYTVYASTDAGVIQFTADPLASAPYDLAAPSGYPGYALHSHVSPVSILGISHGTPFLGKNFCCATTDLYITGGELTASAMAFGSVQTATSSVITVTVTNTTGGAVTLTGISVTGANSSEFSLGGAFPQTLAASGTYSFPVTFVPGALGAKTATLNVTANIGILQAPITGQSVDLLTVSPVSVNTPAVAVGTYGATFTFFTYTGGGSAAITSAVYTGTNASEFSLFVYKNGSPAALPVSFTSLDTVYIQVDCRPASLGLRGALLTVATSVKTFNIPVTGTGI